MKEVVGQSPRRQNSGPGLLDPQIPESQTIGGRFSRGYSPTDHILSVLQPISGESPSRWRMLSKPPYDHFEPSDWKKDDCRPLQRQATVEPSPLQQFTPSLSVGVHSFENVNPGDFANSPLAEVPDELIHR